MTGPWHSGLIAHRAKSPRLPIRTCRLSGVSDTTPGGKDAAMTVPTLGQLAARVSGEIRGDASLEIRGAAPLSKAGPHEITFAGDEKHLRKLPESRAGACLVGRRCRDDRLLQDVPQALLFVDDPQDAFIVVLRQFRGEAPRPRCGVSPDAVISDSATIGPDCNIFPGVFIDENVVIGAHCDLYPGVFVG